MVHADFIINKMKRPESAEGKFELKIRYIYSYCFCLPVPVAARSKA